MDKITNQIIQRYTDNELRLNQLVVNAFARHHNLTVSDGLLAPVSYTHLTLPTTSIV